MGGRIQRLVLRYLAVAVGIGIISSVLIVQWSRRRDPIVQGRRYSLWVADMVTFGPKSAQYAESARIISEFGTNGFPYLIHELTAKESRMAAWKRAMKIWWLAAPNVGWRHMAACRAVAVLGREARPLEPYVTRILTAYAGGPAKATAIEAMAGIHPNDALVLMTNAVALQSLGLDFRMGAAQFALRSGSDPGELISMLLTNSRPEAASGLRTEIESFAREVRTMPIDQAKVEKALVTHATGRWTEARKIVAIAMPAGFPDSKATPLILERLCLDTNSAVRWAATNSYRLWVRAGLSNVEKDSRVESK